MSAQDDMFEQLNNLYEKGSPPPHGLTNLQNTAFMINRFLSMGAKSFWPAQAANLYAWRLPPWATGALLYYMVPVAKKAPKVKYIKKVENAAEAKFDREILIRISRMFHCGHQHSIQTAELLKAQGIDLKALFGIQ